MNIKVRFFEDNFIEAIRAGVYEVYVSMDDDKTEKLLYVGESVFVLVRCAGHLYEISKGKGYFGFDNEMLESKNITLIFKLSAVESDSIERKIKEKEVIKEKNPIMQTGNSDRVKKVEYMIEELKNLLNE